MEDLWKPILNAVYALFWGPKVNERMIQNVGNIRYSDMREKTRDPTVEISGPVELNQKREEEETKLKRAYSLLERRFICLLPLQFCL